MKPQEYSIGLAYTPQRISIPMAKYFWLALPLPFYLFISLGHDFITQIYVGIFHQFGRQVMENHMLWIFTSLPIFFIIYSIIKNLKKNFHDLKSHIILWSIVLLSMFFAHRFLIVTNIEMIHFVQYALLSILLCKIFNDLGFVLLLGFLCGILDEYLQYANHPSYTKYLDFNDFILDGIGAFWGILCFQLIFSFKTYQFPVLEKFFKNTIYLMLALLVITFVLLGLTGRLFLFYDMPSEELISPWLSIEGYKSFVFSFYLNENVWLMTDYGKVYHILNPISGIIILISFFFVFICLLKIFFHQTPSDQTIN